MKRVFSRGKPAGSKRQGRRAGRQRGGDSFAVAGGLLGGSEFNDPSGASAVENEVERLDAGALHVVHQRIDAGGEKSVAERRGDGDDES
ncbi:MAG: hypothetical protein RLZZ142_1439, partial [Verrucomicrobiota bacterium]